MSRPLVLAKNFRSFADLAAAYDEGADYLITRVPRPGSTVGIVAPHRGRIEAHTSETATAIAGSDFSLYILEGARSTGNYAALHLTSHHFDEPSCLEQLAICDDVVAIHGCKVAGKVVLMGGLDNELAAELGAAMTKAGLECHLDGHEFPGTHPNNICNRGRRGVGVQLELSAAFRESSPHNRKLVAAVREVLLLRAARRAQPGAVKPSV
ncbi:MAG: poly-gamma-glutamate hydrolase family protein [Thermomicrobiales bacterium]